jgi:hypothetical protein
MGNGEVGQAHNACLEGLAVGPTALVELTRAAGQAAEVDLVKVAIGPAERRLQHFMKMGEIEVHGKFERGVTGGWMPTMWISARTTRASGSSTMLRMLRGSVAIGSGTLGMVLVGPKTGYCRTGTGAR